MKLGVLGVAALCAAMPLIGYQAKPKKVSPKEAEALQKVQAAQQTQNFPEELNAIANVLENFADTQYKPALLEYAMDAAQRTNDPVQVATWYDRVIAADPNNITARVIFAEVSAAQIRENDLDKATSVAKVNELAHKGLDLIQSGGSPIAAVPADQAEGYKKELAGRAWAAIAMADTADKRKADAITDYKKSFDAFPNSIVGARLTKAYADNKQYDDAIALADKVLAMPDITPQVKNFVTAQKEAATKFKGAK